MRRYVLVPLVLATLIVSVLALRPVPRGTSPVVAAIALPAAVAAPAPPARIEPPPPPRPARVVIISEDGLRPDVLSAELTPRHMQLLGEGASARLANTIRESDTLPSHASMLSGATARAHGLHWNSYKADKGHIKVPTIFSIAREHGLSTAMFVGKPKLRHIVVPGSVDVFERPGYLCGSVARRAAAYFTESKPDLMFVHFSDPDEYGHAKGWLSKEYMAGVAHSDKCLGTLLSAIDASGLGESTLVIVTSDHGGKGRRHSGGKEPSNRQIPWIVRGPGVAKGSTFETPVDTVDTAATVLEALDLPRPVTMVGTGRLGSLR